PASTPGGIFTVRALSDATRPWPLHSRQGSVTTRPTPPHWLHGRDTAKKPWVKRTSPAPPQVGQVRGDFDLLPLPSQASQRLGRGSFTCTSQPNAASSNFSSRL